MYCQAGVAGFDDLRLQVTQAIDLVTGLFEDFKLICLSFRTQISDQHLSIFLVGVSIDGCDNRPASAPEDQVVAFSMTFEVVVEVDAPFRIDLVMHRVDYTRPMYTVGDQAVASPEEKDLIPILRQMLDNLMQIHIVNPV